MADRNKTWPTTGKGHKFLPGGSAPWTLRPGGSSLPILLTSSPPTTPQSLAHRGVTSPTFCQVLGQPAGHGP